MLKRLLKRLIPLNTRIRLLQPFVDYYRHTRKQNLRKYGPHTELFGPLSLSGQYVEMDNHTRLQSGARVISAGGVFRVKKYSAIAVECMIIPGTHVPTVGLPQFLSITHINDTCSEVVIEEDVWVGARCIFLHRAHVGRGAVIGAGSLVTKEVPPYSVVAGSPARIMAVRFTKEQILRHEAILYPPEERMAEEELDRLFATTYKDLRAIGTSEMSDEDRELLRKKKEEYNIPVYADC